MLFKALFYYNITIVLLQWHQRPNNTNNIFFFHSQDRYRLCEKYFIFTVSVIAFETCFNLLC